MSVSSSLDWQEHSAAPEGVLGWDTNAAPAAQDPHGDNYRRDHPAGPESAEEPTAALASSVAHPSVAAAIAQKLTIPGK